MPKIHASAIISGDASIADDVVIGPGCVITGTVRLEAGVELIGNVYLNGPVTIGPRTRVYPGACVGFEPQDVKFKPGMITAGVVIGADCLIREHVTLHAATKPDRPTRVGDRCFLMVNAHMGHDAVIGNDVTLVNNVAMGGHAEIGDKVIMGGNAVIHQFTRIGKLAFVGGMSGLSTDVPPYCMSAGRNRLVGLNIVGMRRNGVPRDQIQVVRQAFRDALMPFLPRDEQLAILNRHAADSPQVREIADFVAECKRSVTPFRTNSRLADATEGE
ncbi:MAG: acyl-ACP--UDP-N-acetylglucosamine O-acyltransferase [Phycisphaerales bacterium]